MQPMPILLAMQISEQYCGREIASSVFTEAIKHVHCTLSYVTYRPAISRNRIFSSSTFALPADLNMALPREDIEFKAVDGTILRGWFYPTKDESPCIIMSHGVSFASPSPRILLTDQVC